MTHSSSKALFLNKKEINIRSKSVKETVSLAKKFSDILEKSDVVLLIGDLGAGKTTFTQALGVALGVKSYINSPTFKLINEYIGKFKIYHFDFYRLTSDEEIEDLGWDEYISSDGIVLAEWADRAKNIWPEKRWEIYFKYINENERQIKIKKSI